MIVGEWTAQITQKSAGIECKNQPLHVCTFFPPHRTIFARKSRKKERGPIS